MDKLDKIFEEQRQLNANFGIDLNSMSDADRKEWAIRFVSGIMQETAEVMECLPWKWWNRKKDNPAEAQKELVDVLHFVVSAAQAIGLTPEKLTEMYLSKNRENHQRITKKLKDEG